MDDKTPMGPGLMSVGDYTRSMLDIIKTLEYLDVVTDVDSMLHVAKHQADVIPTGWTADMPIVAMHKQQAQKTSGLLFEIRACLIAWEAWCRGNEAMKAAIQESLGPKAAKQIEVQVGKMLHKMAEPGAPHHDQGRLN
jgi:hypothetical protein